MIKKLIIGLKASLVLTLIATLFGQVAGPVSINGIGQQFPRVEPYAVFYSALFVLVLLAAQIVTVVTWSLLNMVDRSDIFKPESSARFTIIIWVTATAGILIFVALTHLLFVAEEGGPLVPITALFTLVSGTAIILLLLVLRALLIQSSQNRAELDEVI